MLPLVVIAHPQPKAITDVLSAAGRSAKSVTSGMALWQTMQESQVGLVILSTLLDNGHGLETLDAIHARQPGMQVLVATPPEEPGAVALALRRGATDAMHLPSSEEEMLARVDRLLASAPVEEPEPATHHVTGADGMPRPIFHRSAAMDHAVATLTRISDTRTNVLILGESGVGKELFARSIHFNSHRSSGPWVPLNCTAIPETMIESEMFGHEKGAFTGAIGRTAGKFELAHRGTIFLDEIGDMSAPAQVKLLRVLEDHQVVRVGGTRPLTVDVRLLAATNCDLAARVEEGTFRKDLYYRLNVVTLRVPGLRERGEDLPVLIDHFLEDSVTGNRLGPRRLLPATRALLQAYSWPGNVRELKNMIESLVVTNPGPEIRPEDLPEYIRRPAPGPGPGNLLSAGMSIEEAQKTLIRLTMEQVRGNRIRAAAMLGIGVRTLQRKLQTYKLSRCGRRSSA